VATKNVNIDIIAKDKTRMAMQSATKGVNDLKNNVKRSVSAQTNSFNALGTTIKTVIGGVVAFQALRFSQQMVMMASSVEEMQAKSSVVFGRFVSSVRKELEIFGDNVGRSTQELEGMASSIQDTFVPMGFAREEASKLSVQLTKLAVDVASFNNASDVETMMAFQSALVGNHETVRRFGVVITEATLKQELLRMGINKTATEITNAEKVQARLNLLIAGTSDAQGDAERTNTSFANSMKALNAEFQEFMVEAVTPMLPALSKMIQSLKDSIFQTKEFLRSIGLLSKLNEVVPIVDHLAKNQDKLAEAEAKLAKETKLLDAIQSTTFGEKLKESAKANGEFGLSILEGEQAVLSRIEALKLEIESINTNKELILLDSDARIKNAKAIEKQIEAEKKKNELAKEKLLPTDATSLGIDASMGGFEQTFTNEQKIKGLQDLASLEMQIQEEAFTNKFNRIQEQDELLAEQQRINADETLRIAKETADKQMEIRKKAFNDNFELIKSGRASEIDLEKMSGKDKIDLAKKVGREGLDQLAQSNKKAFQLNKAFRMAEAIMDTAGAVAKVLPNIPLAIAIGAFGAIQIASIASSKYQGRRLGGRVNQGQPYMVGEAGAELIVPDRPSNVVPNNKLGGMSQPVTVNFNINTVDARGFNELLVNSRGTLVNIINSAMNEKGKMAIV
tara:strand:+ start:309 stop:2342 length:2034 start_codon:yes stop_codon:yes gene_type:complete